MVISTRRLSPATRPGAGGKRRACRLADIGACSSTTTTPRHYRRRADGNAVKHRVLRRAGERRGITTMPSMPPPLATVRDVMPSLFLRR